MPAGGNTTLVYGSRPVQIFSLISEAITAVAALVAPTTLARLLFGTDIDFLAQQIVRLAGVAILSLVIAIGPVRSAASPAPQATLGLLVYNVLCTTLLAFVSLSRPTIGPLLWPAVVAHAAVTLGQILTRHQAKSPVVAAAAGRRSGEARTQQDID